MRSLPALLMLALLVYTAHSRAADPPPPSTGKATAASPARPTVKEAQGRAVILHDLANELLRAVHQAYYREDEGLPIPAM